MTTVAQTSTSPIEITPRDLAARLARGEVALIDVREPDEHARERIIGARPLPLSRFNPAQAASFAQAGQSVAFHCRGGKRSLDACRLAAALADRGIPVLNMTGGIEAWKRDGLPVETDARVSRISVMRQVQLVIGASVLAGCALTWFVDARFVAIPAFFGAGLVFAGASGTCALASLIGAMPWNRAATRGGGACRI